MYQVKVFAELSWAVSRPELIFKINNQLTNFKLDIVSSNNHIERAIYTLDINALLPGNQLNVELINKTDNLVTSEADHFVTIRSVEVDGIPAGWKLLEKSKFRHNMPPEWVQDMFLRGIEIQQEYHPGTEMKLNGTFSFHFEHPFLFQKLTAECPI